MMASGIDLFGIAISDKSYDIDTRGEFWYQASKGIDRTGTRRV